MATGAPMDRGQPPSGAVGGATPLVSVVVDATGAEPVDRLLASVLAQRERDIEVLVVTTASGDAALDPTHLAADERIRTMHVPPDADARRRRLRAFNVGAERAAGQYLTFADAAQVWTPRRLTTALAGLARAPVTVCKARAVDQVPSPAPGRGGVPRLSTVALDRACFVPFAAERADAEQTWWSAVSAGVAVETIPACEVLRERRVADVASAEPGSAGTARLTVVQVITDTDRRGAQVFGWDLGAALAARGHDVATVALAPGAQASGLDVEVLGPKRLAPSTLARLRRVVAGADVVVAHGSSTLPACAVALAGARGASGAAVPFVYRQISDSLFWAPTPLRRARVRAYLTRPRRVVALSRRQQRILTEHFGVRAERIDVIPNGVPGDAFHEIDRDEHRRACERFGLDPGRPVVLSISALVPEKGVDLVVEAVAALDGDEQLLVVGDGPERAALDALVSQRLGARGCVAGPVEDPIDAYAAADVVVLASRGGDTMPATLIEAALCGRPSVSTPVGSIDEIVLDARTGRIVPVGDLPALRDAVAEVLGDPLRAADWGRAARDHASSVFTIEAVAAAWEETLYHAVRGRA